jgi:hypothetical protein
MKDQPKFWILHSFDELGNLPKFGRQALGGALLPPAKGLALPTTLGWELL